MGMDKENPNREENSITGDSKEASYGETKSAPERATHFRDSYFIDEDEEETLETSFSESEVAPEEKRTQERESQPSTPFTRESMGTSAASSELQAKAASTAKEETPRPSTSSQQKKKTSQDSVAKTIGRLLGRSLMGFKGDRFEAILTWPYRLVFETIFISLIFLRGSSRMKNGSIPRWTSTQIVSNLSHRSLHMPSHKKTFWSDFASRASR